MIVNKKPYNRILTFCAFSPIHYGHISLFERIKKLCNELIVCCDDDEFIIKVKKNKPVFDFKIRCECVSAIKYVDIVDVQSLKFGKQEAVDKYHPDALAVGDDHRNDYTGEGLGVPVIYLQRTKGISSTILRDKAR